MYIGVWPEYHLAKLVAAKRAADEGPGPEPLPGGSPASGPPSQRRGSKTGCETPSSVTSCASDPIWNVPLVRRVDQLHTLEVPRRPSRGFNIGPEELPAARRSRSEGRRGPGTPTPPAAAAGGRLPPLRRAGREPGRPQQRSVVGRAASQPRTFQPPLPESNGGGSCSSLAGPAPPAAAPPQASRPPSARSSPPVPAGACPRPRTPQEQLGAAGASSPESFVVPPRASLPPTPPWRLPAKGSALASAPSGRGSSASEATSAPAWLSDLRKQVESTRTQFLVEAPSTPGLSLIHI